MEDGGGGHSVPERFFLVREGAIRGCVVREGADREGREEGKKGKVRRRSRLRCCGLKESEARGSLECV